MARIGPNKSSGQCRWIAAFKRIKPKPRCTSPRGFFVSKTAGGGTAKTDESRSGNVKVAPNPTDETDESRKTGVLSVLAVRFRPFCPILVLVPMSAGPKCRQETTLARQSFAQLALNWHKLRFEPMLCSPASSRNADH